MWQKLKEVWDPGTRTGTNQDSGTLTRVMEKVGVWQHRERARNKILFKIIDFRVGKRGKEI